MSPRHNTYRFTMAIPTQHNALLLPSVGADLAIQTVDAHTPDAGEILVRIEIAAINPFSPFSQKTTKIPYEIRRRDAGDAVRD